MDVCSLDACYAEPALDPVHSTRTGVTFSIERVSLFFHSFSTSSFGAFPNATMFQTKRVSTLPGPKASTISKCTPIIVMLPPLLLSIALIAFQSHAILGSWRLYISKNLSAVSAAKQIVAGAMGALQASAVLAILFNFPTRTRLAHLPDGVKLDTLGLLSALSVPRMDWNLPKKHWLLVFLSIGFSHGPAALWASAITPLPMAHSANRGSIMVPSFPEASKDAWSQFGLNQTFNMTSCMVKRTIGVPSFVTNCPIPYRQNALINAARDATAPDGKLRTHSKLDNPQWVYQGRSYGAGSSVGLIPPSEIPADLKLSGYSFEEISYSASVYCEHISHTNLTLKYKLNQESLGVFRLQGTLPNMEKPAHDPIIAWCDESPVGDVCEDPEGAPIFAWFATSDDHGQYMVGIRSTTWYEDDFDNIQCSLEFNPKVFTITVNVTDQSIMVTTNDTATPDPDPTGVLLNNTILSLEFLSKMSPSLYVSVLGDAFSYNLNTTKQAFPHMAPSDAPLRATEASFEAILDDILGIYGSGQILINNYTTTKGIQGIFESYRIGKPLVHAFTFLLNLLIILSILIEAFRTGFWRDLPKYDMMDLKSTVAAASFGGRGISSKIQQKKYGMWKADPGDRELGEIKVCLRQDNSKEPKITLLDSLLHDGVSGEGREMEGPPAPFATDPYKGASLGWSPLGGE